MTEKTAYVEMLSSIIKCSLTETIPCGSEFLADIELGKSNL